MKPSLDALGPSHESRDPRFAELDRLIAEEETYRPKGTDLAEPDSYPPRRVEAYPAGYED
jgi:hypothetical protein